MTTALTPITLDSLGVDQQILNIVAEKAATVDKGEREARYILPLLGKAGYLDPDKGASSNKGDGLLNIARAIRELSRFDLSVGFTVWAHRVTLEYLTVAGTKYALKVAKELAAGERPGISGMAAAFKNLAGCGDIELLATPVEGGYRINGKLNWASNLYENSVLVSAAKTESGERLLFAVEEGAPGLTFGNPFGLLGLNATASAWINIENVFIPEAQVLTKDFENFMSTVRPVFVVLQVAECLGVAEAALAAASNRLHGVNATFSDDVEQLDAQIRAIVVKQENIARSVGAAELSPIELLELRLDAAEAAVAAANIEVRVAGGAGYAKNSPASRRFREAAFIPVQSPSEAQLRWELAQAYAHA